MAHIDDDDAPTPGEAEGAESNGDFSAAFAERATDPTADTREPQADEQSPADQEPAPAGSEQAPASAAASDTGSESEAPAFDPFAGMTPELKAHWEKLQSSERSQRGRVGALTKKLNTLAAGPAPAAPKEGSEQTPAKDGEEAAASDLEARFKSSVEEYGDVVGPVAQVVEALKAEIAELKASPQREQPAVSDDETEAMAQAYDVLAQDHSDYQQIAVSPEFQQWAMAKPGSVQGLVNSFDPAEVSLALTLYKAEAGLARAAEGEAGKPGSTADDRRKRQLEGSRDTPSRGAPVAAGVPNDFKTAFNARIEQHKRAAT